MGKEESLAAKEYDNSAVHLKARRSLLLVSLLYG
jgi:hypothetical protein